MSSFVLGFPMYISTGCIKCNTKLKQDDESYLRVYHFISAVHGEFMVP